MEGIPHLAARALGELIEAVEDDPDQRRAGQVVQGSQDLLTQEVDPLPLSERNTPLELLDGLREPGHRKPELAFQVVDGQAAEVGRRIEKCDGVREAGRNQAVGDLGPGQGRRQGRFAHARLARHDDNRVGPAGLDQLAELGRGLEDSVRFRIWSRLRLSFQNTRPGRRAVLRPR